MFRLFFQDTAQQWRTEHGRCFGTEHRRRPGQWRHLRIVLLEVSLVIESQITMAMRAGEAFDLSDPLGIRVVIHHVLGFAPSLG